MTTRRRYQISPLNPDQLQIELDDCAVAKTMHVEHLGGAEVDVVSSDDVDFDEPADTDILDAVAVAHDGASLSKSLRLGDYFVVPSVIWEPPLSLDYTKALKIRLKRKMTFVKGELQKVEYHPDATVNPDGSITYDNGAVVREDYTYTRDAIGLALSRTLTITWICQDDSDHPTTKTMIKVYNRSQRMKEGKRRRGNVVDDLEVLVAALLIETELENQGNDIDATVNLGRGFTTTYGDEIRDYVQVGKKDILQSVLDDTTYTWLNNQPLSLGGTVSIRDMIHATLDIWAP